MAFQIGIVILVTGMCICAKNSFSFVWIGPLHKLPEAYSETIMSTNQIIINAALTQEEIGFRKASI